MLHGRDLIFSLIVQTRLDPDRLGSAQTSYAKIHEGVRMALKGCGLDSKFYSSEEALLKGNDCFDFPVESDLSWKGKKIAGGAQKRSEGVLLHHESILIPPGVDRDELIGAIRKGLAQMFGVTIESADLDPEIYFAAQRSLENRMNENGVMSAVHSPRKRPVDCGPSTMDG